MLLVKVFSRLVMLRNVVLFDFEGLVMVINLFLWMCRFSDCRVWVFICLVWNILVIECILSMIVFFCGLLRMVCVGELVDGDFFGIVE